MLLRYFNQFFNIQHDEERFSWLALFLLVFNSLLSISPLSGVLGFGGVRLLAIQILILAFLYFLRARNIKKIQLYGFLLLFGFSLLPAIFWSEPRLAIYPIFFFLSLTIFGFMTIKEVNVFVDVASYFILIILIGGVVGFILAFSGVEPYLVFENRDGRPNFFFYTTLTNSYWGFFIRPSGLYDEPGTLAFITGFIIFFRQVTNRDYKLTWILLILGFITFSLAYFLFVIVFLFSTQITKNKIKVLATSSALILLLLVFSGLLQEIIDILQATLIRRISFDTENVKGIFARSTLLMNALNVIIEQPGSILWGADPDCTLNIASCVDEFGYISDNPLAPLVQHGIFISWPYYLFLSFMVYYSIRGRKHYAFIAIGILLLQRPYVIHYGYSFLSILALYLQMNRNYFDSNEDFTELNEGLESREF